MRTAIRTAASVSSSVGSARSRMASVTGLRRKIELPRSPWSRRPYQRTSWTWSGWSRPSCWAILLTSSAEASGPAMMEAGAPGARGISTKPTRATTSAPGVSARSRRRTHVFTPAPGPPGEPGGEALDLPPHGLPRGVVAELDPADVLVEEELDLVPHRLPLPGVGLSGHGVQPALLVLVAPPPGPVALHARVVRRLGIERDPGGEGVPQLGLVAPLDERRPVDDLQVDTQAERLQLLPGDQRVLVHPLVLPRRDPAHRRAGVARLLQELLRPGGIPLVVELGAHRRVPLRLLDVHEARVDAVK